MRVARSEVKRLPVFLTVVWMLAAAWFEGSAIASQSLRYDREYPVIEYSRRTPVDAVSRLNERIETGEWMLPFEEGHGYLAGLLRELEIPISSQILVYTKTSFQKGLISPETPRAIYFRDDVYVAFVQGGPNLEISAVDPVLGATFYTLDQQVQETGGGRLTLDRQTHLCLRCHDSYGLTGGGVPRHIMGSGLATSTGRLASHEGWALTTPATPIEERWGGWYVTGNVAPMRHLGNVVLEEAPLVAADLSFPSEDVRSLDERIDTSPYLSPYSDVVALLVFEHQVHVQNLFTRVGWDARMFLSTEREPYEGEDGLETIVEPLVRALLFLDEAPLTSPVESTSGFDVDFAARGPRDEKGRSLRTLELNERVFRYPVSYLLYSETFDALPREVREQVYARVHAALLSDTKELGVPESERRATIEILTETKPDYARWVSEGR